MSARAWAAGAAAWLSVAAGVWAAEATPDLRRSGFEFMSPQTQAMQRDDGLNPAMLWVAEGEGLWSRKAGRAEKSCSDCHGDARQSMRGVAARYPSFEPALQRPIDLGQRIGRCRQNHQKASPWPAESVDLLSLQTYIAMQSRGMAVEPDPHPASVPFRERGRQLYVQRIGQLNLSCAQCHDDLAGLRLGSSPIPQAHATGYPIYRLEWQGMGSLQRRLRACMTGVRAEPFAFGAPELVELELFLAQRSRGMAVETPAVRP